MVRQLVQRYGDALLAVAFVALTAVQVGADGSLSAAEKLGAGAMALRSRWRSRSGGGRR